MFEYFTMVACGQYFEFPVVFSAMFPHVEWTNTMHQFKVRKYS